MGPVPAAPAALATTASMAAARLGKGTTMLRMCVPHVRWAASPTLRRPSHAKSARQVCKGRQCRLCVGTHVVALLSLTALCLLSPPLLQAPLPMRLALQSAMT